MCTICVRRMIQAIHDKPEAHAIDVIKEFDGHSREFKCPAMLALESLTPSGSEFWEDPKNCVQRVRDSQESVMRVIKSNVKLRNDLIGSVQRIQSRLEVSYNSLNAASNLYRDLTDAYLELYNHCCHFGETPNFWTGLGGKPAWDEPGYEDSIPALCKKCQKECADSLDNPFCAKCLEEELEKIWRERVARNPEYVKDATALAEHLKQKAVQGLKLPNPVDGELIHVGFSEEEKKQVSAFRKKYKGILSLIDYPIDSDDWDQMPKRTASLGIMLWNMAERSSNTPFYIGQTAGKLFATLPKEIVFAGNDKPGAV
jgi:hypothetical protein